MFKFIAARYLAITTNNSYDAQGQPELTVTIEGDWELQNLQNDVFELKSQMFEVQANIHNEEMLRRTNPALKDMYDQYKVVLALTKEATNADACNGGS